MLTEKFALKNMALPLSVDKRTITVAMGDPLDLGAISDISFASGREVRPTVAPLKEVKSAIRRFYNLAQPLQKILGEIQGGSLEVIGEPRNALRGGGRRGRPQRRIPPDYPAREQHRHSRGPQSGQRYSF